MPDPSIGFNSASALNGFALASNGAALNSTSSGEKKSAEKTSKVTELRYPYNLKIDRDTDYLDISIGTYSPSNSLSIEKEESKLTVTPPAPNSSNPTVFSDEKGQITDTTSILQQFGKLNPAGIKDIRTYIRLPIPQSISDTTSVSWGPDTLDPLSAFAVSQGANLINNNFDLRTVGTDLIKQAKSINLTERTKSAIIAAASSKAYGAFGGNVSISGLISRASGQVFNPNLELLFNGVNLRSFPFIFDFAPRNSAEAKVVKSIIREFKKAMTAKSTTQAGAGGIFIKTPDIFKLVYKRGPNPHPFLNKFKLMALTDMQLNYTGSNTYATYADGTPVHIQMTLTFTELSPVYNDDYVDSEGNDSDTTVGF